MDKVIYDVLLVIMLVISAILVISILMQPSKKQDGAADAFSGGSGELFERRKARGLEAVMQRFTGITIGIWLVLGFILVVLSTK